MRKRKWWQTDSEACIAYRDEQPGLKNLIDIYCACLGKTSEEPIREFEGKGYGDLKMAVGEAVVSVLKPLQRLFSGKTGKRYEIFDPLLRKMQNVQYFANKTLRKVQRKVGFPGQNPVRDRRCLL